MMKRAFLAFIIAIFAIGDVVGQQTYDKQVKMDSTSYVLRERAAIVTSNQLATLGLDISGTSSNSTVVGLQGYAIPAPAGVGDTGKSYIWDGAAWLLSAGGGGASTTSWGLVTGSITNQTDLWSFLSRAAYTNAENTFTEAQRFDNLVVFDNNIHYEGATTIRGSANTDDLTIEGGNANGGNILLYSQISGAGILLRARANASPNSGIIFAGGSWPTPETRMHPDGLWDFYANTVSNLVLDANSGTITANATTGEQIVNWQTLTNAIATIAGAQPVTNAVTTTFLSPSFTVMPSGVYPNAYISLIASNDDVNIQGISVDIDAGQFITLDAPYITLHGTGSPTPVSITSDDQYLMQSTNRMWLTSIAESLQLSAGTVINLLPTGDLQINGVAGVTSNGFSKGILTDYAALSVALLPVTNTVTTLFTNDTDFTVSLGGTADITLSGTTLSLQSSLLLDVDAPTIDMDGNTLTIDTTDNIIVNAATDINLNAGTSMRILSGTYMDLIPTGALRINGVDGATGIGFSKGIMTNTATLLAAVLTTNDSPTMAAGTTWGFDGATVAIDASNGIQVVNWQTMTNHIATHDLQSVADIGSMITNGSVVLKMTGADEVLGYTVFHAYDVATPTTDYVTLDVGPAPRVTARNNDEIAYLATGGGYAAQFQNNAASVVAYIGATDEAGRFHSGNGTQVAVLSDNGQGGTMPYAGYFTQTAMGSVYLCGTNYTVDVLGSLNASNYYVGGVAGVTSNGFSKGILTDYATMLSAVLTTNDSPTMAAGTQWTFALADVTNNATAGTDVVNYQTMTNWGANAELLVADVGRFKQEVVEVVTNDLQLTLDDGGKCYMVQGTAEVVISLPTNSTASTVGMDFRFVNLSTNILTIDAPTGVSIEDSDPDGQIYSGSDGTNLWPWSSITLKQADSNFWHSLAARGTWTTTGTNATPIPTGQLPVGYDQMVSYVSGQGILTTNSSPTMAAGTQWTFALADVTNNASSGTDVVNYQTMVVADTALSNAYVAADTTLSNALTTIIDLKVDITGGVATNLALNGSTESVDATNTTMVVNWRTMTNYVAATEVGLTTNDSPTMAAGTQWTFALADVTNNASSGTEVVNYQTMLAQNYADKDLYNVFTETNRFTKPVRFVFDAQAEINVTYKPVDGAYLQNGDDEDIMYIGTSGWGLFDPQTGNQIIAAVGTPTLKDDGGIWTSEGAASNGLQIVNWQTMTNHLASNGYVTTNDSPTMAEGTTWTFDDLSVGGTGVISTLEATLATIDKGRIKQEVAESITSDTQLTLDDGGKVFIVDTSAGDVTMSLPTNATAVTVGTDFRFINVSTNLLIIDAYDVDSIEDSDLGAQIYSGVDQTNDWPWSSITLKQAESNWWHSLAARGDWTTTGTNASPIPSGSLPVSYGQMTSYIDGLGHLTTNDSPTMVGGSTWTFALANVTNNADSGTEVVNYQTMVVADTALSNAYVAADTALSNAYVVADTTLSNALTTIIDLKVDITGGVATNLALNGSTENIAASSGTQVVNWQTMTNHTYGIFLTTNSSPTMAEGTEWTFDDLAVTGTGTVSTLESALATIDKGRIKQEVAEIVTNDLQLTVDDAGKVFIVKGAIADVTFSLPTNITASTVGLDYRFVNLTTNLLIIDAFDTDFIDDSSLGAQVYSGIDQTNDWPFSSITLKQADSNWWHSLAARGDWTTTGTNATYDVPPAVRAIGGEMMMTANITNNVVSYGAVYTVDMFPTVTIGTNATSLSAPEIVDMTRSNFTFRVRTAAGFNTNAWHMLWNAAPAP